MKVRFTGRSVRVRIDDLELAALARGEEQRVAVTWPGGGWSLTLDPGADGVHGAAGEVRVGMRPVLADLLRPEQEGVNLEGPPVVTVEKEFGPQHA